MNHQRRRLFDLRPDEGRRVVRVGAAMFAILAAHTVAETARDAMFLRALPPTQLPLVYGVLAVLAIAALRLNAAMVRRVGRRKALIGTLWVSAAGTLGFHELPASGEAAFALYLWTGLLGTIMIVQFWLLAGELFTTTQGKRLFGPIAALGACGTLAGAWGAGAVVAFLPVQDLLVVSAIFYLVAARILWAGRVDAIRPRRPVRDPTAATGAWARLREEPYLRRLAALMALTTAGALIADYLFKTSVSVAVPAADLPGFFARFNGVVAAVSLALQVIGASWLLRRVGVVGALAILPLCLLIGGIASVAMVGGLVAVALTKGADGTLRHSVNRVAGEILWMPLPEPERPTVREPIDSLGVRLVQAVVAGGLLVASLAGLARPTLLAAVLAVVAAVWLAVALTMRRAYLDRLRQALARPSFAFDQDLDLASIEVVVEALSSTEPRRVIAAMHVLSERGRARLVPALILLHDAPEVLLEALRVVAVPGRRDWRPLGRKLAEHPSPEVRAAALRALVRAGDRSLLDGAGADPDPTPRAHAAFWLAATDGDVADDPRIAALLAEPGPEGDRGRLALLDAIREDGDRRWASVLLALLRTGDAATVEAVVLATERVPELRLLPVLVERLGVRSGRASVRGALVRLGEPALTQLERAFRDPGTPRRVRLHMPAAIAQFGSPRAGAFLVNALGIERSGAVRYRILRSLARLAIHRRLRLDRVALIIEMQRHLREHFRLLGLAVALDRGGAVPGGDGGDLLRGLLRDKLGQALERVFLLLQAAHPNEDIRGLEQAIRSTDRVARAHAIEFFDNLTRSAPYQRPEAAGLRELLAIAIDDLPPSERIERAAMVDRPAGPADALSRLVRDDDALLASIAAYHALELGVARMRDDVLTVGRSRPILAPLGLGIVELPYGR
jgi:hypothetical protein